MLGLPSLEAIKLAGAGIAIAGAFAFAFGLKGRLDDSHLADVQLADQREMDRRTGLWQDAVNKYQRALELAQEAARAQTAAWMGAYTDAINQHVQTEVQQAALVARLRLDSQRVQRDLAAAAAAAATAQSGGGGSVPGAAAGAGSGAGGSGGPLGWIERVVGFAQRCAEHDAAQHSAIVEAVKAWPAPAR